MGPSPARDHSRTRPARRRQDALAQTRSRFLQVYQTDSRPRGFFFASNSEYKGMDAQELKSLSDAFHRQMAAPVKKRCPIVAAPGPDVLRIRFAITDLRQNRPVLSDFTSDWTCRVRQRRFSESICPIVARLRCNMRRAYAI